MGHKLPCADSATSPNTCRRRSSVSETDEINRQYQEQWEKDTRDVKQGNDVAVLLFSWVKDKKHSMNTAAELRDLEEVFRTKYDFKVRTVWLSTEKTVLPRYQLQTALLNFLIENDKPGTRLIIYYGGHGKPTENNEELRLLGGNPAEGRQDSTELLWSDIESQLHRIRADLLLILDCCYAGLVDRYKREWPASRAHFEFIASTAFDKTARGPRSDGSFTRAMINAFHDLADEPEPSFTTTKLVSTIKASKPFRRTMQQPFISECGKTNSFGRLKFTPSSRAPTPDYPPSTDTHEPDKEINFYLHLKYVFRGKPSHEHISTLAERLGDMVKNDRLPISQAVWEGLTEYNPRMRMADAAHMLRARLGSRRRSGDRLEISAGNGKPNAKVQRTLTTLTMDENLVEMYQGSSNKRRKLDDENGVIGE